MVPESHSLRHLFHQLVEDCYAEHVGIRDAEVSSYVADLLTDFTETDRLYQLRDSAGRPIEEVGAMMTASDPIHGTAASFDEERHIRKHIGDYTLFLTGMYPESLHLWRQRVKFLQMVRAGKESYWIVSQFNVFEYAQEAPLFEKLAESFEGCVYGLTKVRGEMEKRKVVQPATRPERIM
jgi:hypothetical protein